MLALSTPVTVLVMVVAAVLVGAVLWLLSGGRLTVVSNDEPSRRRPAPET